ncbi:MAG: EamA family transporter [Nitrospirae bacterium]|nr:EamA family transporter [Nitrospirota bacterium]
MLYILTAIFLWSSLGIVIKLSGVSVHVLMFFSCIISVLLAGSVLSKREFRREMPKGKNIAHFLALGLVSLINTFSFFYAYKYTSIANAVLTHYTAPVIVAFLAPVFLRERLTMKILLAVAVATAGLWVMLGVSAGELFRLAVAGDRSTGGILAGLFSGFAYALLIILIRILAKDFNPLILAFFQNLIIAAVLAPFVFSTPRLLDSLTSAWWAFAVMGVVHSTIAPVLYFRGMRDVTANRTAILGYLEPVCAIFLGALFFNETVDYKTIIGGVMILFSGYLTITGNRP